MATISERAVPQAASSHLRPFEAYRDMTPVADLVELCFAGLLDGEGRRYLQNMRSAARAPGLFSLSSLVEEWSSVPLSGFVWEEDGRLVGNLSLIPQRFQGKRLYLIANVAVHPDYRRRGIGSALTERAVEYARKAGARSVWLHVREGNQAAIDIYQRLGFVEYTRRTTWYSRADIDPALPPPGVVIRPRHASLWQTQQAWLDACHPPELRWYLPLRPNNLRPGLRGALTRLGNAVSVRQWCAWKDGRLLGVLACQSNMGYGSLMWLVVDPTAGVPAMGNTVMVDPTQPGPAADAAADAAAALLYHARLEYPRRQAFVLDYPAHHAEEAIRLAGFTVHQTLLWMKIDF